MKRSEREFRSLSTCFGATDTKHPLKKVASFSLLIVILPFLFIYLGIEYLLSQRYKKNKRM